MTRRSSSLVIAAMSARASSGFASVTAYRRCDDCIDEATCTLHRVLVAVRDATADILENRTLNEALTPPAAKKTKRRSAGAAAPARVVVP